MNTARSLVFLALGAAAASAAHAAVPDTPWSVTVFGGGAVAEDGTLRNRATRDDIRLNRLDFDDLYHRRYEAGAEVSYDIQPNLEAFGRISFDSGDGRSRPIGSLESTGTPLEARFADEDSWSLDLGSRFFFRAGEALRPFAGLALGATRMDAIKAQVALPAGPQDVRFARTDTVFSQTLEAGVQYAAMQNLDLRLSLDATHFGAAPAIRNPTALEADLGTRQPQQDRWAFPVSIGAVYHFG